eukprot:6492403-Amphidinium_carterae.1
MNLSSIPIEVRCALCEGGEGLAQVQMGEDWQDGIEAAEVLIYPKAHQARTRGIRQTMRSREMARAFSMLAQPARSDAMAAPDDDNNDDDDDQDSEQTFLAPDSIIDSNSEPELPEVDGEDMRIGQRLGQRTSYEHRGETWGPFSIAPVMNYGVHVGFLGVCKRHSCYEGRDCQRQLWFGSNTAVETRCL